MPSRVHRFYNYIQLEQLRGHDRQQSLFLSVVATAELLRQSARRSLLVEQLGGRAGGEPGADGRPGVPGVASPTANQWGRGHTPRESAITVGWHSRPVGSRCARGIPAHESGLLPWSGRSMTGNPRL